MITFMLREFDLRFFFVLFFLNAGAVSVASAGTCMGTLSLLASDREPRVQPWSRGHTDTPPPGSPSRIGRSELLARETVALLYSKPAPLLLGNWAR